MSIYTHIAPGIPYTHASGLNVFESSADNDIAAGTTETLAFNILSLGEENTNIFDFLASPNRTQINIKTPIKASINTDLILSPVSPPGTTMDGVAEMILVRGGSNIIIAAQEISFDAGTSASNLYSVDMDFSGLLLPGDVIYVQISCLLGSTSDITVKQGSTLLIS